MELTTHEPLSLDPLTQRDGQDTRSRPNQMELSVVVPTFNSAEHIYTCLSSVRDCLPEAEVIVVDNDSADETREVVREAFPAVVLISGHGNLGFGRACNLGAKHASYEYLLYLNPDAELVSIDLSVLARLGRNRPLGIVAATLVGDNDAPQPTVQRRSDRWFSEFVAVHLLAMLSPYSPRPRYVEQAQGLGAYTVSGAIFLVAVDEFHLLGGFDKRFFMYYEDTDLARRYLQLGYPLRSSPALLASHVGGASAPTPQRLALSFLGWLEYIDKWHGRTSAMRAVTVARVVFSTALLALRGLAPAIRSGRVSAKAEQLATMLSYVAAEGRQDDSSGSQYRYPNAGPIATRTFRSFE